MNNIIDKLAQQAHLEVDKVICDLHSQGLSSPDQVYRAFSGMAHSMSADCGDLMYTTDKKAETK
jgi:hypothetical protein